MSVTTILVWSDLINPTEQLKYEVNTLYQPLPSARCCDICKPRLFETEAISVEKKPGLKRGKKRAMPEAFVESVREGLREWREELVEMIYPNTVMISPATVLGDDVIEQLATCGERIGDANELKQ